MWKYLFLVFLIPAVVEAQERSFYADSLFSTYESLKHGNLPGKSSAPEDVKCAFQLVNSVRTNLESFSQEQQQMLTKMFQRIPRNKSIVTPGGFFRLHYNVTGADIPRYIPTLSPDENALLVAEALDSAYNYQVNYLGYLPPPSDNGAGGDNLYDVYIANTGGGGGGSYGYTEFEDEVSPGSRTFTSFMVIDDDYNGFYSSGIDGARVTVAHELHHGIQGGSYIYRSSDIYYYELTSTAMEEFVYDSVNDYYAYMHSYFQNPGIALTQQNGYNIAIFNLFLEARYDHNLLKRIWELMVQDTSLIAINRALIERNSSFDLEYPQFGIWTYFTGYRSQYGSYFEEAENYKLIRPMMAVNFSSPNETVNGTSKPTGNNFIIFINGIDTLASLICNTDIRSALSVPLTNHTFTYELYDYEASGSAKLTDNYYMNFSADKPILWQTAAVLNNFLLDGGPIGNITADYPFPSPFSYSRNYVTGPYIFIPIDRSFTSGTVELNVYTTSMELVYNNVEAVIGSINNNLVYAVRWNPVSLKGRKLSTGVYIYSVKSGDEIKTGKFVIFND